MVRFLGFPALQSNNFGKKPPPTFPIVFLSRDQFSTFFLSKIKLKVFTFTCRNLQRNPSSQTLLKATLLYILEALFLVIFQVEIGLNSLEFISANFDVGLSCTSIFVFKRIVYNAVHTRLE